MGPSYMLYRTCWLFGSCYIGCIEKRFLLRFSNGNLRISKSSFYKTYAKSAKNGDGNTHLNIIAVADHGMAEISSERTVDLSAYTDMSQIIQEGSGPYAFLYSKRKNIIEPAVDQLKKAEHSSVYLKSDIPDRDHFKNHHRIKDALIVADEGWYIQNQAISSSSTAGEYVPTGGTHGYDNQLKSMHALFIAQGPAFKKDIVTKPFENVNIYPMIAHILGIDPSEKIDGNLNNIKHLLK